MLEMSQLMSVFKNMFLDRSYGRSLQDYITSHNPKDTVDVEFLERQWQYRNIKSTGGSWL